MGRNADVTRPDTRHKMRLVGVLFTFENNWGRTDGRTDRRTDTPSYRDATAHIKRQSNFENADSLLCFSVLTRIGLFSVLQFVLFVCFQSRIGWFLFSLFFSFSSPLSLSSTQSQRIQFPFSAFSPFSVESCGDF